MEENKEPTGADMSREEAILKQLESIRSRQKTLKIAGILLSILFILLIAAVGFMYKKMSNLRDIFMPEREWSSSEGFSSDADNTLPAPVQSLFKARVQDTAAQPGSSLTVFTNTSEYTGKPAMTEEDSERLRGIMARYSDRPIVKDFMAELQKDPDLRKVMLEKGARDPMTALSVLRDTGGMQQIVKKFAFRKDFLPFMMEVMRDPQMKEVLSKSPMGGFNAAQMLKDISPEDLKAAQAQVTGSTPSRKAGATRAARKANTVAPSAPDEE